MGFGDWLKGLFGNKKETAADGGATSGDANGKPAETEAAPSATETSPGDAGGSSDPAS